MASVNTTPNKAALPDWWERERQRRLRYTFIFLCFLGLLIAYWYWVNGAGPTVPGIPYDTTNTIAFIRQDAQNNTAIYSVRADGSDLRQLTDADDKSYKQEPAWTLDGKRLLYVSNRNEAQTRQIYMLGQEHQVDQITYGTGNKSAPVALPDGKEFAFIVQGAIKTEYFNKTGVSQILPPPTAGNSGDESAPNAGEDPTLAIQGAFRTVAFSSDGRSVAGVKDVNGENVGPVEMGGVMLGDQAAFVLPASSDKSFMLNTGHDVSVAWAPDGARLLCAFSELQFPHSDNKKTMQSGLVLWTLDKKTSPTPLLLALGYTFEPLDIAWSPDGAKIAFEGWKIKDDDHRESMGLFIKDFPLPNPIYIKSQDDVKRQVPTVPASADGVPQNPRWSPDGQHLLYEVMRGNGQRDLWVINSDGTNPINLTKGQGDNYQGAWSPVHPGK